MNNISDDIIVKALEGSIGPLNFLNRISKKGG